MASRLFPQTTFFDSLRQSSYTYAVRPDFLVSPSAKFVNPRDHVLNTDRVTQTLPTPEVASLGDERVLALFTGGFFGGFIFGIERFILQLGGYNILPARFTGFDIPSDAVTIWNNSNVPETDLLPIGSCLFGSFRLLDKHIAAVPSADEPSYVDFAFGSDEFNFGGCHRFQINHLPVAETKVAGQEEDVPQIQMELQHFRCNPQKNQSSAAEILMGLHYIYAKALFANGIQALLSA